MALQTRPDALTPQEVLYCAEYVKDFNASRAYGVAFKPAKGKKKLSPSYIRSAASRLMDKPAIRNQIAIATKDNMEKAVGLTSDDILQKCLAELSAIAFFDVRPFIRLVPVGRAFVGADAIGGRYRPEFDMEKLLADPIACKALSLETGTTGDGEGGVIDIYKLKKYGKLEALDKLLKYAMIAQGKGPAFGGDMNVQQMVLNVTFPVPGSQRDKTADAVDADYSEAEG